MCSSVSACEYLADITISFSSHVLCTSFNDQTRVVFWNMPRITPPKPLYTHTHTPHSCTLHKQQGVVLIVVYLYFSICLGHFPATARAFIYSTVMRSNHHTYTHTHTHSVMYLRYLSLDVISFDVDLDLTFFRVLTGMCHRSVTNICHFGLHRCHRWYVMKNRPIYLARKL